MDIGNKIITLRKQYNMTQEELANSLQMTSQNIYNYEKNMRVPPPDVIVKLCQIFNVSADHLLGRIEPSNVSPASLPTDTVKVKVYGKIAAGVPCEAIEDIIGEEEIPREWLRGGKQYFGLVVQGESMSPYYLNGDIVICLKTPKCETGDDAIVIINGGDATLKQVAVEPDGILLKPLNDAYKAVFYANAEIESLPVSMLGVVVQSVRYKKKR